MTGLRSGLMGAREAQKKQAEKSHVGFILHLANWFNQKLRQT
jgi:hypothetical protein